MLRADRPPAARWRRVVAATAVVAVFAFGLPRFADYSDAWRQVKTMSTSDTATLLAAAAWNLASYLLLLVAALPGLRLVQAALANQASTAISNTVPGGGAWGMAVTWSMYRSFGFSREETARALAVTGFWNVAVKLATPALALGLLAAGDDAPPWVLVVSSVVLLVVGGAVSALLVRDETAAGRAAARLDDLLAHWRVRARVGDRVERLRRDTIDLVGQRWRSISAAAVVSHTSLFLVLLVALRAVGVGRGSVSLGEAVTAFAVVRVALIVPLTPGGAGIAELGLTGMLVAAGGEADAVVAGVLVFRAATWLLPIPLGALAYLWWSTTRSRDSEAVPTP